MHHLHHKAHSRRLALRHIASLAGITVLPNYAWALPQPAASAEELPHLTYRALSRIGYGPHPDLLAAVQAAGDPAAWSLAQIGLAQAASQHAPAMPAELAEFQGPLPSLFEAAKQERKLRAEIKAGATVAESEALRRLDFTAPHDPLHFSRTVAQQAAVWHLRAASMPSEENPLLARMTEFWFNHLNVYVGKGAVRPFAGHYLVHVARAHALGKFEDLLLASARHPAMLLYLDQSQSVAEGTRGGRSRGLNENYARELMELHTLGVSGGYTQNDVRELARVLTGWTVDPDGSSGFRFMSRAHDGGAKQVMGQRFSGAGLLGGDGESEGVRAIRMLARHPKTAKRISLRLAQFFVSDTPSPTLVARMSEVFLASGGDISELLRVLIASDDFWNPENRLFKTPMDYACSALCAIQGAADRRSLELTLGFLNNAGQPLHGWQTPDGYKTDAATWLVPEALTRRADFALALTRRTPPLGFLEPFVSASTRATVVSEKADLRAGLLLASPEFMYK
jgi:uncharacterized protein (DUF1800 family)